MAVKSKEDILNALKQTFGDDTSDETLSLIEDVSDTYDDMSSKVQESGDWKSKYEENDKAWREKYRDRFYSKPIDEAEPETELETEPNKPRNFEDLFKTE